VVLGRGSKPEVELRQGAVEADAVPVLRRRGGGCAVVLDPGNVIVAVTFAAPGFGENLAHFARLSRWVIDGLAEIGLHGVRQDGTSDLVHGDRKVGGSCIYRGRGVLLYSTTILIRPDLELAERYLAHPPREPDYRRGRTHSDFMGRLCDIAGSSPAEEVPGLLARTLSSPPVP